MHIQQITGEKQFLLKACRHLATVPLATWHHVLHLLGLLLALFCLHTLGGPKE